MTKYILFVAFAAILAGCSDKSADRGPVLPQLPFSGYKVICIDGVEYHVISVYKKLAMAPKFLPLGEVSTCAVNEIGLNE